MDTFNRRQELEHLREESRELEERAGLTQKIEDAHHPHANPEWSSKEYSEFADLWLHSETRTLYFSVANTELRKKLIAIKRKIDACYQLLLEEEVIEAKHDVSVANAKTWHQSWLKAVIYGLVVIIVSCWIFGIKGSILGIVFVIWFLTNERDEIKFEQSQATERLRYAQTVKTEESNVLETFSLTEEQNGTEDIFDDKPTRLPYATGKSR